MPVPCAPLPLPRPTMSPFDDDAYFLSGTRAEGSLELRRLQQQPVHGAPSSSPLPPPRRARAAGISCQGYYCCRRAKAGCAHRRCRSCCRRIGFVCSAHANRLPRGPASSSQCSERQRVHAALAADRKRPRALPSVAATPTTSSSSVDQPMATAAAAGWFAREVSLDAVFRRVRLMGPPEAEVAYHTTVTIAGHVFRGVLYDVGTHHSRSADASDTEDGSCDDGSSWSTAARGSCLLDLTLRL